MNLNGASVKDLAAEIVRRAMAYKDGKVLATLAVLHVLSSLRELEIAPDGRGDLEDAIVFIEDQLDRFRSDLARVDRNNPLVNVSSSDEWIMA